MIGAAVRTKALNRHHALPATWRGTGARSGASSSTSEGWRPGIIAFAPTPAAIATAPTTANAASATGTPANGASAAITTAERAEHGVRVTSHDASSRSRRVRRTRVP